MSRTTQVLEHRAIRLKPWSQWLCGLVGVGGIAAGAVAVFVTKVEAGPVALMALGAIFLVTGISGVLPTNLKLGAYEAGWSERLQRMEDLGSQIGSALIADDITNEAVLTRTASLPSETRSSLSAMVSTLSSDVRDVSTELGSGNIPPDALLPLATWNAAEQRWEDAAEYYDLYVQQRPDDWEVQFLRGVAHANSRTGRQSDLAALSAYDAALASRTEDAPQDLVARLLIYRGGIKKRLDRLQEAASDVILGQRMAVQPYEQVDASYNLAAIRAMQGDREGAMVEIRNLASLGHKDLIAGHLNDYFSSLRDDPEFKSVIES